MKKPSYAYAVLTAAVLATLAVPVYAGGGGEAPYVGASVGQSKYKDTCNDAAASGFIGSCDDSDTGWKLFGGYQFTPNWGVEGFYADLGTTKATGTVVVVVPPPTPVAITAEGEATVLGVAVTGTLPLGDKFGVFGKLGFHYWDAKVTGTGGAGGVGVTLSGDDTGTDVMYGLGARYSFTDQLSVRAEWERFKVGDNKNMISEKDVDLYSVGIGYTF